MSKKCLLVHVLKNQANEKVNLNNSPLLDSDQYVSINDIVEECNWWDNLLKAY